MGGGGDVALFAFRQRDLEATSRETYDLTEHMECLSDGDCVQPEGRWQSVRASHQIVLEGRTARPPARGFAASTGDLLSSSLAKRPRPNNCTRPPVATC
jgi:hypothetical protein